MEETTRRFTAIVDYEDPYVQPLLLAAFEKLVPPSTYTLLEDVVEDELPKGPLLQIRAYESIDFERALKDETALINAYIIRKALIRKHFLSHTVQQWTTKYPESVLKQHVKPSNQFEVDYSEFLDDALLDAYELRESCERNIGLEPREREWWILKPSMTDRGQGIRLFGTEEELQNIFAQWDPDGSDDEDESSDDGKHSGDEDENGEDSLGANGSYMNRLDDLTTAHLRDFVAQPYIHPPLLLPSSADHKFHIRTYVLAVGALNVYVYRPMLALFAEKPYQPPWEIDDMRAHLTNTCIQETGDREGAVRAFWGLEDSVPSLGTANWKEGVYEQICNVTGELFLAAAKNNAVHFQPLPNAFELFGLDYLVDERGKTWLLEVNAFPDFKQTGDELKGLIAGLFEEVVEVAIKPFFGVEGSAKGTARMRNVLDIDLGRR